MTLFDLDKIRDEKAAIYRGVAGWDAAVFKSGWEALREYLAKHPQELAELFPNQNASIDNRGRCHGCEPCKRMKKLKDEAFLARTQGETETTL
jgi:hypothetical protein